MEERERRVTERDRGGGGARRGVGTGDKSDGRVSDRGVNPRRPAPSCPLQI